MSQAAQIEAFFSESAQIVAPMKVIAHQQGSTAWKQWRQSGSTGEGLITATNACIIAAGAGLIEPATWMGSVEDLWMIKTGRKGEVVKENFVMRRGSEGEPLARAAFERETRVAVSPMCCESNVFPFMGASLDGIDFDYMHIAEIKVASEKVHTLAKEGTVIGYYVPQIVHQAICAFGHPDQWSAEHKISFVSYQPETDDLAHVTKSALEYKSFALDLIQAEIEFWDKVKNDRLPCGDEWRDAATRFLDAQGLLEAAKEAVEVCRAELISLMGTQDKMRGAGVAVARQTRKGAVDYAKYIKSLTQGSTDFSAFLQTLDIGEEVLAEYQKNLKIGNDVLEAYRKKSSTSIVVRVLDGKKSDEADEADEEKT